MVLHNTWFAPAPSSVMHVTNVVHTFLCSDLQATKETVAVMRSIGEIAGMNVLPVENGLSILEVTYFDVRAASKASQVLGAECCWPAAPIGMRTVRLPGVMKIDVDVLPKISGMSEDLDQGCYVVEFFDIRDAARYQAKAATAVSLNGQGAAPSPPPGFESSKNEEDTQSILEVMIEGLPKALLTDGMMEVMLEQAGLESNFLSFSISCGGKCGGTVVVRVNSSAAAQQCVRHFAGCHWCSSGAPVTARIVSKGLRTDSSNAAGSRRRVADLPGLSRDERLLIQMEEREDRERGNDAANAETFGADATSTWSYQDQVAANRKLASMLEMGVGVPSLKHAPRSDVSTDISESEGEVA